ncbi:MULTISPECIES: AAA family ATPase [unclassified Variovorax]|uniref:AAA family ATPase n=1 Tax=unclassified Variovorax TaxID=663243 RepID=UPI00076D3DAF|nr:MULTISPECIES: AAA family ATPase [unclassified Variovorax]KWT95574.1 hypothetical protein APY03_2451 [Variovorax sp. WDL1]PNG50186.1 hypothetical protein CHC06_05809 [Variovorax sp. B2]PNG51059.1 hypothetical protein CHC07_05715 [Variovorax sp. B4]VTV17239.1 hypothetical protein WDL1P1_00225 [Variovorax sp. WDL1]
MYTSISFTGLKRSPLFGYAAQLPFFAGRKKLDFKPGLNILFGPNGCGKSTVLRILSDTMCATQGGVSAITEESLRSTIEAPFQKAAVDGIGLKVTHDGQPAVFVDSRKQIGVSGGSFDEDFLREGIMSKLSEREASHGQVSVQRINRALAILAGKAKMPTDIVRKVGAGNLNSVWKPKLELIEGRMAASIEPGQPSILLDEPESNFSIEWQSQLWHAFAQERSTASFQIIVATHSVFALGISGANYVEFTPGALAKAKDALLAKARGLSAEPTA